MGMIVLAGGDEFRRAYDGPDRALLGLLPPNAGHIVILPTAASRQGPEQAIANGVRHFKSLAPQAPVEGALVIDEASANDSALAMRIASAGMVYLTGGDPGYLVQVLRGSEALAAIAAVVARGGVVAGSSAGAMALGEQMRWAGGWQPALDQVHGVVALPHHGNRPLPLDRVRAGLPESFVALGLPTGVNCVGLRAAGDGDQFSWRVFGKHPVTIYRSNGVTQARDGETFF